MHLGGAALGGLASSIRRDTPLQMGNALVPVLTGRGTSRSGASLAPVGCVASTAAVAVDGAVDSGKGAWRLERGGGHRGRRRRQRSSAAAAVTVR